jgi:hypothetical protein
LLAELRVLRLFLAQQSKAGMLRRIEQEQSHARNRQVLAGLAGRFAAGQELLARVVVEAEHARQRIPRPVGIERLVPAVGADRKDQRPREQDALPLHQHGLVELAGLLRLVDQDQFVLPGVVEELGMVVAEKLVGKRVFVGEIEAERRAQRGLELPGHRRQIIRLAAERRAEDRNEERRHFEKDARQPQMAVRARQVLTNGAANVEGQAGYVEARRQEALRLGGENGVAHQVGMGGDPFDLVGREALPAMGAGDLRPQIDRRIDGGHKGLEKATEAPQAAH